MKKYNSKQILYANKMAFKDRQRKQTTFVLLLFAFVAVFSTIGIFSDPLFGQTGLTLLGGSGFATMMVIGDIGDVADMHTTGNNIFRDVYLIDVEEQIDTSQAFPQPNASREVGTVPILAGQYMKRFTAHTHPKYSSNSESGDNSASGTNGLEIVMAGNRDQLKTFAEQHLGKLFIPIFRNVDSTAYRILGSYDKPCKLKSYEFKDDAEGRYVTFKFERSSIYQDYNYTGAIVTQAATVHTADNATLAITAGQDVYTIPDGGAATYAINAISGLTASDKGRIITLKGSGTTKSATIADGAAFTLEDATTWTGKAGSKLVLRVLDANTLVEVQGSRVQTA